MPVGYGFSHFGVRSSDMKPPLLGDNIILALGLIFKIPKAFISYGSPRNRPCGSAILVTIDAFRHKRYNPGIKGS